MMAAILWASVIETLKSWFTVSMFNCIRDRFSWWCRDSRRRQTSCRVVMVYWTLDYRFRCRDRWGSHRQERWFRFRWSRRWCYWHSCSFIDWWRTWFSLCFEFPVLLRMRSLPGRSSCWQVRYRPVATVKRCWWMLSWFALRKSFRARGRWLLVCLFRCLRVDSRLSIAGTVLRVVGLQLILETFISL